MFKKLSITGIALAIGIGCGFVLSRMAIPESAFAQQPPHVLIQGHGRAISSLKPPDSELFTFDAHRGAFKVVPAGKKFVLTDVMYIAQRSVRQDLVVNIASANPATRTDNILFQVKLLPGQSDQVHLCSGYVIPAGNAVVAFTNAGLEPEQYVSVSVTGYLADESRF